MDDTVRIWDIQKALLNTIPEWTFKEHLKNLNGVTFSNDGTLIATGKKDLLQILDYKKFRITKVFKDQSGNSIIDIVFSNNNKFIACSGGRIVSVFELNNLFERVFEYGALPYKIAISKNDKLIAAGGIENKILVWDIEDDKENFCIENTRITFSLAFSSCGKYIISEDQNKVFSVWELKSGKLLEIIGGDGNASELYPKRIFRYKYDDEKKSYCKVNRSIVLNQKQSTAFRLKPFKYLSVMIDNETEKWIGVLPISGEIAPVYNPHPDGRTWIADDFGYISIIKLEGEPKAINNPYEIHFASQNIDGFKSNLKNEQTSKDNDQKSEINIEDFDSRIEKAKRYLKKAGRFVSEDNIEDAEKHYRYVIDICEKIPSSIKNNCLVIKAEAWYRLALLIHWSKKDYPEAMKIYEQATSLLCQVYHLPYDKCAIAINNLAFLYFEEKMFLKAHNGFYQSYLLFKSLNNETKATNALCNWAMCKVELGDIVKAEPILRKHEELTSFLIE
jgi:tetratricopeptide (TPR) repeat protein